MKPVTRRILWWLALAMLIGVPASIAVPNFREALERSRQKRTLADMRTIATAWEARATDLNRYTDSGVEGVLDLKAFSFDELPAISQAEVKKLLVGRYIREMPVKDGWGNDFEYRATANAYVIRSLGSDGLPDPEPYELEPTNSFSADILLSLGNFVRYPEGI